MPIRTQHGPAAAFRRAFAWPIRTRRNSVMTFAVLAALMTGTAVLSAQLSGTSSTGPAAAVMTTALPTPSAPTTTTTTTTTTAAPPVTSLTTPAPVTTTTVPPAVPAADAPPEAVEAARRFATAWVHHPEGITTAMWSAQIAPQVTDESRVLLADIDPARIIETSVTADPVATAVGPSVITMEVPTNGDRLRLDLLATPDGWRVRSWSPVEG